MSKAVSSGVGLLVGRLVDCVLCGIVGVTVCLISVLCVSGVRSAVPVFAGGRRLGQPYARPKPWPQGRIWLRQLWRSKRRSLRRLQ